MFLLIYRVKNLKENCITTVSPVKEWMKIAKIMATQTDPRINLREFEYLMKEPITVIDYILGSKEFVIHLARFNRGQKANSKPLVVTKSLHTFSY